MAILATSCGGGAGSSATADTASTTGLSISPPTVTFGSQAVGTASAAQTNTLTNSGNAALSISSIALSGTNPSDFAQTNNCGSSVAAGANCTISVTFKPTASGNSHRRRHPHRQCSRQPAEREPLRNGHGVLRQPFSHQPHFRQPSRRRLQRGSDDHPDQLRQRRLEHYRHRASPAPTPATLQKPIIAGQAWRQEPTARSALPSSRPRQEPAPQPSPSRTTLPAARRP